MKIFVRAKSNAKEEWVKKISDAHFEVTVKEPPIQDKANEAIIRVLARYFHTASSNIAIISGRASRQKIIEVKQ